MRIVRRDPEIRGAPKDEFGRQIDRMEAHFAELREDLRLRRIEGVIFQTPQIGQDDRHEFDPLRARFLGEPADDFPVSTPILSFVKAAVIRYVLVARIGPGAHPVEPLPEKNHEVGFPEPAEVAVDLYGLGIVDVEKEQRQVGMVFDPFAPEGLELLFGVVVTHAEIQDLHVLCAKAPFKALSESVGEGHAPSQRERVPERKDPGPASTETRQTLRRLANEGNWDELMQQCLRAMAEPCGRVWLDVHRYAWRAAQGNSNYRLAAAVVATVRGLLTDMPDILGLMMDDDTPAANAETQQWIVAEILPPPPEAPVETTSQEPEPEPASQPIYASENRAEQPPDIFDTALAVLKRGRVAEAINMLVRDSEQQPSGRMRFQRRVQMAQLCLTANQGAVAYPVLRDLSIEMERRSLETWEAAEMLSAPLSLLLKCLDQRNASEQDREAIFERLCRLDPQAALTVR